MFEGRGMKPQHFEQHRMILELMAELRLKAANTWAPDGPGLAPGELPTARVGAPACAETCYTWRRRVKGAEAGAGEPR